MHSLLKGNLLVIIIGISWHFSMLTLVLKLSGGCLGSLLVCVLLSAQLTIGMILRPCLIVLVVFIARYLQKIKHADLTVKIVVLSTAGAQSQIQGSFYPGQLRYQVLLSYLTGTQEGVDHLDIVDLIGNGALYHFSHLHLLSGHEAHYRRTCIQSCYKVVLKSQRLFDRYGDSNWIRHIILLLRAKRKTLLTLLKGLLTDGALPAEVCENKIFQILL